MRLFRYDCSSLPFSPHCHQASSLTPRLFHNSLPTYSFEAAAPYPLAITFLSPGFSWSLSIPSFFLPLSVVPLFPSCLFFIFGRVVFSHLFVICKKRFERSTWGVRSTKWLEWRIASASDVFGTGCMGQFLLRTSPFEGPLFIGTSFLILRGTSSRLFSLW